MQITFIPRHYPPPAPTHIFFMTAPQDTEAYIQNEVIPALINFASKLRIRFATLFEKHLLFRSYTSNMKLIDLTLVGIIGKKT